MHERSDIDLRWSAIPWTLLVDQALGAADLRVYGAIAGRCFRSDTVQVGTRWIADSLHIAQSTTARSVRRLVTHKYLEVLREPSGSRAALYHLTSPVFSKRQKVIVQDKHGARMETRHSLNELRERLRQSA